MSEIAKLKYAHMCDYASVDQLGKTNALGMFDKFQFPNFPATKPSFYIIAHIDMTEIDNDQHIIKLEILSHDNKSIGAEVASIEGKLNNKDGIRIVVGFGNVKFDKDGDYKIQFSVDDKSIGKIEFPVVKIDKSHG